MRTRVLTLGREVAEQDARDDCEVYRASSRDWSVEDIVARLTPPEVAFWPRYPRSTAHVH